MNEKLVQLISHIWTFGDNQIIWEINWQFKLLLLSFNLYLEGVKGIENQQAGCVVS